MRIGEIARAAGLASSAVRYYERIGLLPRAVRRSGSRDYDASILDRLALIGFAQACGFRIAEIRALLAGDSPRRRARQRWKPLAQAKLLELDEAERRLRAMRVLLQQTLRCNCVDIAACGRTIRKLDMAPARPPRGRTRRAPLAR